MPPVCDEAHIGAVRLCLNACQGAARSGPGCGGESGMSTSELVAIAVATVLGLALIAAVTMATVGA